MFSSLSKLVGTKCNRCSAMKADLECR